MDEPLSNLDARLRLAMRGEIKRLCHRIGATTIYVTHDQAEAMTMADLVAVMGAGSLQQVGAPEEIYDRPANRFVATFVGNPPMNILKASLSGGKLAVGGIFISAPPELRAVNSIAELGIRPEDISIVDPGTQGSMTGEVYVVEPMGSETFLDVSIAGERLTARLEKGFRRAIGSSVGVRFDTADACYFDASGVTIVHRAQSKGGSKQ
jgi:multiple sugar transport system ATP-binding protein